MYLHHDFKLNSIIQVLDSKHAGHKKPHSLLALSLIACISTCFFVQTAHAANVTSELTMTIEILQNTCEVSLAENSKIVNLGEHDTRDLRQIGDRSPAKNFNIELRDCSPNTNINVSFTGNADLNDSSLLALSHESTATNVGIAIQDALDNRVQLNGLASRFQTDATGNLSLIFSANYVATGRSTPGIANGTAEFSIDYD